MTWKAALICQIVLKLPETELSWLVVGHVGRQRVFDVPAVFVFHKLF